MAIHDTPTFLPDIESLLTPIQRECPAGPSLRYDPMYLEILQAREEDDASLPMGEWTRPLIKADWKAVSSQCADLLSNQSKDLQVAAWLCDAWTRIHQLKGFIAGVDLLTGLVARYWENAHPQIEGSDDDARAAPFIWLNENLSQTLKLHMTFIHLPEHTPSAIGLADWDRTLVQDKQHRNESRNKPALSDKTATRADMTAYAEGNNLQTLIHMGDQLQLAIEKWNVFAILLDEKMVANQPSVARVEDVLQRIAQVLASLIDGRFTKPDPDVVLTGSATTVPLLTHQQDAVMTDTKTQESLVGISKSIQNLGAISSREDAYRQLEAVATYLTKTEPHSPTPYLVKRAVAWGRMSLDDLMREVVREEGDLTRYFLLLGIKSIE